MAERAAHLVDRVLPDVAVRQGPLGCNTSVFSEARIDRYVQAYSKPAALHAGFEYYRAFEKDTADNRDYERNKLSMPVLALGGEQSRLNKYVIDQLRLVPAAAPDG